MLIDVRPCLSLFLMDCGSDGWMDGRQDCESTSGDRVKGKRRVDSSVHLLLRSQARKYSQARSPTPSVIDTPIETRGEESEGDVFGGRECRDLVTTTTTSSRDNFAEIDKDVIPGVLCFASRRAHHSLRIGRMTSIDFMIEINIMIH